MVVCIEVMCLTSHDHVTKPTTILRGKKCIVAFVSACLRSFRSHGKELLRCWVYKQVRERQEFKLLPFSSGTEQASKMDGSSKQKIGCLTGTRGFATHTSFPEQKVMILCLLYSCSLCVFVCGAPS